MDSRTRTFALGCLMAALAVGSAPQAVAAKEILNVVVIFMDDMAYADIGPFGAKAYPTPHLDRMAKEGRKFTDFYVTQAVCSASRAGLLTGCYNVRVGIFGALGPKSNNGLHANEVTLAELCKQKGTPPRSTANGTWPPQTIPANAARVRRLLWAAVLERYVAVPSGRAAPADERTTQTLAPPAVDRRAERDHQHTGLWQ